MKMTVLILLLTGAPGLLNTATAGAEPFFASPLAGETIAASRVPVVESQATRAFPGSGGTSFEDRFAKGKYQFGLSLGGGFNFTLPPTGLKPAERTDFRFIHFSPNYKYNLTGPVGSSFYQGALYWVIEAGVTMTIRDPHRDGRPVDKAPNYVFGIVPFQLEYKFVSPQRSWAPFVYGGVGGSWGDWYDEAAEISTAYEFILQAGAGLEYFFDNGTSVNLHYRLWHLSNANAKSPNAGVNAHVISLGFSF